LITTGEREIAMFNPFEQKPMPIKETVLDWKTMYPKPYDKKKVDPYTRLRIILMNGIEVEGTIFSHQFHRNCSDNDLRRELAMARRAEQQQQKHINWLKPLDETPLETTIGYEHVAVDLTAWLAQNEPDPYVKESLDFALLEDFDHLYRFANLLDLDEGIPSEQIVKNYVEITPGRPTIAEHRHPYDTVRKPVDFKKADIRTMLNTLITVAGEQQTMNFYMNIGNTYQNDLGRKLFMEIAMIEEEHVSQYGSLLDPDSTWLENLLLHEYVECYLYYSFANDESDRYVKSIWEMHLEQEIAHLHKAAELLGKYENRQWEELIPGAFPKLLRFHDTRDYVRKILKEQVELSEDKERLTNVHELPEKHTFFDYQNRINRDVNAVPSHLVINEHQKEKRQDYRLEQKPNPVKALRDREHDNTDMGRTR
jgi:rubrerythrin